MVFFFCFLRAPHVVLDNILQCTRGTRSEIFIDFLVDTLSHKRICHTDQTIVNKHCGIIIILRQKVVFFCTTII